MPACSLAGGEPSLFLHTHPGEVGQRKGVQAGTAGGAKFGTQQTWKMRWRRVARDQARLLWGFRRTAPPRTCRLRAQIRDLEIVPCTRMHTVYAWKLASESKGGRKHLVQKHTDSRILSNCACLFWTSRKLHRARIRKLCPYCVLRHCSTTVHSRNHHSSWGKKKKHATENIAVFGCWILICFQFFYSSIILPIRSVPSTAEPSVHEWCNMRMVTLALAIEDGQRVLCRNFSYLYFSSISISSWSRSH